MISVVSVDSEIEAELARGLLQSEGIAAMVRFSGRSGYPRYAAGTGVVGVTTPLATYEVLVAEADAVTARAILAERDAPAARTGLWRRSVMRVFALIALASFVAPLLIAALQRVRLLF